MGEPVNERESADPKERTGETEKKVGIVNLQKGVIDEKG
jgi:hypothetical protein